MRGKRLKDKLAAGRPVFTTPLNFYAPRLVELLAQSGADQIFLDAEHGTLSERDCEDMVRAADLYDLPVQIRVPVNEPHVILRFLDVGASGIMVPHVATAEDAARAIEAIKYPPQGRRGFAAGRPLELFRLGPVEYLRRANLETFSVMLVEDVAALPNLAAICQTPGVDGVFVGSNDLAGSLGYPGEPFRDEVQAVVDQMRQVCRAHGMPFGSVPRNRASLRGLVERGDRLITVGTLGWGLEVTREVVAELG